MKEAFVIKKQRMYIEILEVMVNSRRRVKFRTHLGLAIGFIFCDKKNDKKDVKV